MTIYSDTDLVFREENEIFGGQKFASDNQQASMQLQQPDVWSNFYEKLNDTYVIQYSSWTNLLQVFHDRYQSGALVDEQESSIDAE